MSILSRIRERLEAPYPALKHRWKERRNDTHNNTP